QKAPVIIKTDLSMVEATLIVTETNLRQRSFADMSHSERAYCLAQHYEALKSQGKRSDLLEEIKILLKPDEIKGNATSSQVLTKLRSDEKVGQEYGLNRDKVAKYIRLSKLIPSLLDRTDKGEISFLAAYDLSFIEDQEVQQKIEDFIVSDDFKIDMKKAEMLRSYYEQSKLTDSNLQDILSGEKTRKPKSNKPEPVKVKPAVISKYFTANQSKKEIEQVIEQALELFFSVQQSYQDNDKLPEQEM
ncbi:MAG: ParB N-terminal domain-containing protein, partial [Lachnospiraceae bacterium]